MQLFNLGREKKLSTLPIGKAVVHEKPAKPAVSLVKAFVYCLLANVVDFGQLSEFLRLAIETMAIV